MNTEGEKLRFVWEALKREREKEKKALTRPGHKYSVGSMGRVEQKGSNQY